MSRVTVRDLISLAGIGLLARVIAAWPVDYAPYTDPAYYSLVAERLAGGDGFTVPVIWSFLEVGGRLPDPALLPVPSNGHWMPLTSIIAAGPMWLLGPSWRAGQLPSVLLSAALVPMTAAIAAWLFEGRSVAIVAGVLAIFAGPLLVYYPTIDNFAIFGVLGAGAIATSIRSVQVPDGGRWLVVSGLLCALATLARVDGLLLAVAPATAWLARGEFRKPSGWLIGLGSAAAFLVVLAPWLLRNLATFGSAMPSAGARTLWITSYNEQFSIGHEVSFATYLASGPAEIIGSKVGAWFELLGRMTVLLGGIFVITFIAGLWMSRRRRDLWPFVAYFVVMFVVMGGLFTFHAPRGAYYHSAAAWLPFAIPLAVASLPAVATAGGRAWPFLRRPQTHRFLLVVGTLGAVLLSVAGSLAIWQEWNRDHALNVKAATWLRAHAAPDDVVMSADPAALALMSANPGVAAPFDPFALIGSVVDAYHVRWVVVIRPADAATDPLNLWPGRAATDVEGTHPEFLPAQPALDTDAMRIYEVTRP